MLTASQRDRIEVVLVSPRNPLNIGAAARAMANFGFARLTVVAPFEAHWREAKSAVGAPELLKNARQTATFAEAVADCTLVIGTGTLTHRKPEQTVVPLPKLAPIIRDEIACSGRIAIVFGSEKRGLTRDDLARCDALVEIPTDPHQPSMNLGQAVAVCLYEIALRLNVHPEPDVKAPVNVGAVTATSQPHPEPGQTDSPAAAKLELLTSIVEETMAAANYSPAEMRKANRHDVQLMLRRLALTDRDTKRLLGLFRRILWRLRR